MTSALSYLLAIAVSFCLWVIPTSIYFDSIPGALARLRGDVVYFESPIVEFGEIESGSQVSSSLVIHNSGSTPVKIIGGTFDCSCSVLGNIPTTVEPFGSIRLTVNMNVPKGQGDFEHRAKIWTDSETNDLLRFTLRGRSSGLSVVSHSLEGER